MRSKISPFSNFSNTIQTASSCLRPDNEKELRVITQTALGKSLLARGNGLSYSDCSLNTLGMTLDLCRFNHLLAFDEETGLLSCQGAVSFADLFLVHPNYIPPVIPGTLHATLAGGIANDIHGKNNHLRGSLGQHLEALDLQINNEIYSCSRNNNADLFYATIGGLGLTGIIHRVVLKMQPASQVVETETQSFDNFEKLLSAMQTQGITYDYQVAWLDLINKPRALLSLANHSSQTLNYNYHPFSIPKLPFRLINPWLMKHYNNYYFQKKRPALQSLSQFNNPLDSILRWNRLYGKKGLLQFQAVFDTQIAASILEKLLEIIRDSEATAVLAVLKYFTQASSGLLSFSQPGFSLALDFINNKPSRDAIFAMNTFITALKGKVYLAKDLLLTPEQFRFQYPQYKAFSQLLKKYQSPMQSDLARRLGIKHAE